MYNLLIVDDEEIIRQGIVDVITSNVPNFNVRSAKDGMEALELIEQEIIDAMILDIKMPKLDGIELLKILMGKNIRIRTIVLSGYDEFEYAKVALEYGAYNYLLKPVVPMEIIKIVNELDVELTKERKQSEELQSLKK